MKKIICLTPVKNEAWILDNFLAAASLWADHIVVLDQHSTDGSREIAAKYHKVTLFQNQGEYDEAARQKQLLAAARSISPGAVLLALDADEFLSANFMSDPDWAGIRDLVPGTVIKLSWDNVYKDTDTFWNVSKPKPFGFVDDGVSEHSGSKIHSERLPAHSGSEVVVLENIHVMHFQYLDWSRMLAKQRWYQCWERIHQPRSAASIYRSYHHMDNIRRQDLRQIPSSWFAGYEKLGIHLRKVAQEDHYWYDLEVLRFMEQYGARYFRREAIWDVDWQAKAAYYGFEHPEIFSDPRSPWNKASQFLLRLTQPLYPYSPARFAKRVRARLKRK